jgi:hypothetical protein
MAQSYADFKTYILTHLWRENDTALQNNLDVLIQKADDELDKMTRDWQRRQRSARIQPTTVDFDLTAAVSDFQAVRSLTQNVTGFSKSLTQALPQEIYHLRATCGDTMQPYYAVERDATTFYLRLVGPLSVSNAGDLQLAYRAALPDYASADASWLEDEYLDLYSYTVMKHCALFLREDERLQTYTAMQIAALETAEIDDKHNLQFGGSPLRVRPHHVIP